MFAVHIAKDLRVPGQGLTRAGEEEPTWNSRPGASGPGRPWRPRTCTALALPHAVPTAPRRPPPHAPNPHSIYS